MTPELKTKADLDRFTNQRTGVTLFSAPWCAPCKTYKPMLEALLAENGIPFRTVNVDEARDLAGEKGVRAVPTTIIHSDGVELARISGAATSAAIRHVLGLHNLLLIE